MWLFACFNQIPGLNKCDENQHELISVGTGKATDAALTGNSWDFWILRWKTFCEKMTYPVPWFMDKETICCCLIYSKVVFQFKMIEAM